MKINSGRSNELAPKNLARRKGWTLKYVYDLLAAGRIPGARKIGKRWLIPAKALQPLGADQAVAKRAPGN